MGGSDIVYLDSKTGFAFPSRLSDWTVEEAVKHYGSGHGYRVTYERADEFADVFVYNKWLTTVSEQVLFAEFVGCKEDIVRLQGSHGYRIVKEFPDTVLSAKSEGQALRFWASRCIYIERGHSIDSWLLMAVVMDHFVKLRNTMSLKSPQDAAVAVITEFLDHLSNLLLQGEN